VLLEQHLRATEREDAGQRPAPDRKRAIGGTGGKDDRIERDSGGAMVLDGVERAVFDAPGQRLRPVVDALSQARENRMGAPVVIGFGAEQGLDIEPQSGTRLPIDLAARTASFVDHDRRNTARHECACGCDSGRTRPDNGDVDHRGTIPGVSDVTMCMPSATIVVQARRRCPSASDTQQSWHAPIRQKSGARLAAEFMPAQRVVCREDRNQHAFAGVSRHLRAIDANAQWRTLRHNRAYQSAIHDCLRNVRDSARSCFRQHHREERNGIP